MNNCSLPSNAALLRLQEAIHEADSLPAWLISFGAVLALLSFIILLHLLAAVLIGPCIYVFYTRRQRLAERELVPTEEELATEDVQDGKKDAE